MKAKDKLEYTVISETSPMLAKAQIEAIAAKLSANGLGPGALVVGVDGVYDLSDPEQAEEYRRGMEAIRHGLRAARGDDPIDD